ncbi:MAG: acyl-CoA dehydrogenase family protein, partial [Leptospirales bacterium]|nr:acyl-CoA dehydrogenase family protein [Leptospirales bacterium]
MSNSTSGKTLGTIGFSLTEEQRMMIDMAADFADKEIKPFASEWDKDEHNPMDVLQKMFELGLTNIGVPAEYGGMELDNLTRYMIVDEIAQRDTGVATTITAHSLLATDPVMVGANDEQKKWWFGRMMEGGMGAF